MNIVESGKKQIIACEAFIRRAAVVDAPFMLKGSFVTRQYFQNPQDRIPNDLDWVFLEKINYTEEAERNFTDWAVKVTEIEVDDGVKFRNFRENSFWRMIDYAMSDDSPTVNTDFLCWIDGEAFDNLSLDISFNLPAVLEPIPLAYKPLDGEIFTIPKTVPLALQISWKLHQTLIRPRFKDIFDLTRLLKHPSFDSQMLEQTLEALTKECLADNVDARNLRWLLTGELQKLFPYNSLTPRWNYWRFSGESASSYINYYEKAEHITDAERIPKKISEFADELKNAMIGAGFTIQIIENLPAPKSFEEKIFGSDESKSSLLERFKDFFK